MPPLEMSGILSEHGVGATARGGGYGYDHETRRVVHDSQFHEPMKMNTYFSFMLRD